MLVAVGPVESLMNSMRSVALEAFKDCSFFKGSEKGSGQGSRRRVIWGNYQNQINSFERDQEN